MSRRTKLAFFMPALCERFERSCSSSSVKRTVRTTL
jgi:hypothetical protein